MDKVNRAQTVVYVMTETPSSSEFDAVVPESLPVPESISGSCQVY
jgi:hypothetical protein